MLGNMLEICLAIEKTEPNCDSPKKILNLLLFDTD